MELLTRPNGSAKDLAGFKVRPLTDLVVSYSMLAACTPTVQHSYSVARSFSTTKFMAFFSPILQALNRCFPQSATCGYHGHKSQTMVVACSFFE